MRILVTAFAFAPGQGSEAGVGWNWVWAMAARGWEVTVLTRHQHGVIAAEWLQKDGSDIATRIHVHAVGVHRLQQLSQNFGLARYLYQYLWQYLAYREGRKIVRARAHDIVHSLTYGGARIPSFLGWLRIPFLLGPVGGGEAAPLQLVRPLGLVGFLIEATRLASNIASRVSPLNAMKYAHAARILIRTPETVALVPVRHRDKIIIMGEVGVTDSSLSSAKGGCRDSDYFIFSARFLYWKGGEIALRAFAIYRANGGQASLTMVGQGPSQARWRKLASELGVADAVRWVGWIERAKFIELLGGARALLFPSLHDAGGNVVYEALLSDVPVIAFQLGGPGLLLDELGLPVIPARGRSFDEVVKEFADRMLHPLPRDSAAIRATVERYFRTHQWGDLVDKAYAGLLPASAVRNERTMTESDACGSAA